MHYIKRVKAENLFSWKELNCSFSDATTYAFKGENGVGKSSVFEIIIWVLFHKTTKKNVKGDYGKTDGWGRVTLKWGDHVLRIQRNTTTPNAVYINTEMVTQEYLEDIIGCNFSTFMAANMCSQKRVSAFVGESSDAGKAKIFGQMLGCGILDKMREKINKKKNSYEVQYAEAKGKVDSCSETIDTIKMELDDVEVDEYLKMIDKRKKKLKKLEEKNKILSEEYKGAIAIDKLWQSWDKWQTGKKMIEENIGKDIEKLNNMKKELDNSELDKLRENLKEISEQRDEYETKIAKASHNCSSIQSTISELQNIIAIDGECPTCKTEITASTKKNMKKKIKELEENLIESKEYFKKIQKETIQLRKDEIAFRDDVNKIEQLLVQVKQLEASIRERTKSIESSGMKKPEIKRPDLQSIIDQVNICSTNYHEYDKIIVQMESNVNNLNKAVDKLESCKTLLDKLEKLYYKYKWLFDNLPLMKLYFINRNKVALENAINDNILNMGLYFHIEIDTQKKLKTSDEVRDKFSFKIINNVRKREADKRDLSGGEEICILLATQFAINDISGNNIGCEIYDEVFGALDSKNEQIIIEAIKNRAKSRQVFTISHKEEISNSFHNTISIGKKEGYSYVR